MENQASPKPKKPTDAEKQWAALIYIGTPLVPILTLMQEEKKSSPFIKAHNTQALIWGIPFYTIVLLTSFGLVGVCLFGIGIGIQIYWALKALRGEIVEIPYITDLAKKYRP